MTYTLPSAPRRMVPVLISCVFLSSDMMSSSSPTVRSVNRYGVATKIVLYALRNLSIALLSFVISRFVRGQDAGRAGGHFQLADRDRMSGAEAVQLDAMRAPQALAQPLRKHCFAVDDVGGKHGTPIGM